MGSLLWLALLPACVAAAGTAQFHDFRYLGPTEIRPSLRDGDDRTICLDDAGAPIHSRRACLPRSGVAGTAHPAPITNRRDPRCIFADGGPKVLLRTCP